MFGGVDPIFPNTHQTECIILLCGVFARRFSMKLQNVGLVHRKSSYSRPLPDWFFDDGNMFILDNSGDSLLIPIHDQDEPFLW
jgi:hypothetical protein